MIAAGVNAKALSTYMGHSSVTITYDRYGHLMPGNVDEAVARLDAFLKRTEPRGRPRRPYWRAWSRSRARSSGIR